MYKIEWSIDRKIGGAMYKLYNADGNLIGYKESTGELVEYKCHLILSVDIRFLFNELASYLSELDSKLSLLGKESERTVEKTLHNSAIYKASKGRLHIEVINNRHEVEIIGGNIGYFYNFTPLRLAYAFAFGTMSNLNRIVDISSIDFRYIDSLSNIYRLSCDIKEVNFGNHPESTNLRTIRDCFIGSVVEKVDMSGLESSAIVDMESAFVNCVLMRELKLFNTSSVINMKRTFSGCRHLEEILSTLNLDTSSVKDFNETFSRTDITTFDIPLDTHNCENMTMMFSDCSGLTDIDLSSFDTRKVKYFGGIFDNTSLVSLDITSFNFDSAIEVNNMFPYTLRTLKLKQRALDKLIELKAFSAWQLNNFNIITENGVYKPCIQ